MTEVPQAFRDAIETEWRNDDKLNAEILTVRFRATTRFACNHKEAENFKDAIEEHVASELHKFVSGLVGEAEETAKLRELVADMWRGMCNNYSRNCFVCRHYPRAASPNCECEFRTRMRELGIEVDQ